MSLIRIKSGPFVTNGVLTDFALLSAPGTAENLDVFADGLRVSDFELIGDLTLRIPSTLALTVGVEIYTWSAALPA